MGLYVLNVEGNYLLGGFVGLLNPPDNFRKQNPPESDKRLLFVFAFGRLPWFQFSHTRFLRLKQRGDGISGRELTKKK